MIHPQKIISFGTLHNRILFYDSGNSFLLENPFGYPFYASVATKCIPATLTDCLLTYQENQLFYVKNFMFKQNILFYFYTLIQRKIIFILDMHFYLKIIQKNHLEFHGMNMTLNNIICLLLKITLIKLLHKNIFSQVILLLVLRDKQHDKNKKNN